MRSGTRDETSEAREPYFEVIVDLQVDSMPGPGYGMTGTLCFGGARESIWTIMSRRLSRFIQKLMQMDWVMVLGAVALAIVSALVAAIYPTWRVCNVTPATQLRIQ